MAEAGDSDWRSLRAVCEITAYLRRVQCLNDIITMVFDYINFIYVRYIKDASISANNCYR